MKRCIAFMPKAGVSEAWVPCTAPVDSDNLCAAHYDALYGVFLGWQSSGKLDELEKEAAKRLNASEIWQYVLKKGEE
jgi:hypothetical protein